MVDSELDLASYRHNIAFIKIKAHLPGFGPVSNRVDVILKGDFILGAPDFTIHYSVISKQPFLILVS